MQAGKAETAHPVPLVRAGVVALAFVFGAAGLSVADDSDYIIRVVYEGSQTVHEAEVLLFDTDRACDTLYVHPNNPPSGDLAWTSVAIPADAEGAFPDTGLNLPPEVELYYAVARGEPSDGAGGGAGFFSTFGCNDQIPVPSPSGPVVIEIHMEDIPIHPETSPPEQNFGAVEVDSSESRSFTFANDGVLTVVIDSVTVTGPFFLTQGSPPETELPPDSSLNLQVAFTPPDPGPQEGMLLVSYELLALPPGHQWYVEQVPLSGTGVEPGSTGWSEASVVGAGPVSPSSALNCLVGLLIPGVAVLLWKGRRKDP